VAATPVVHLARSSETLNEKYFGSGFHCNSGEVAAVDVVAGTEVEVGVEFDQSAAVVAAGRTASADAVVVD